MFVELELPPRPRLVDAGGDMPAEYYDAVRRAAEVRRAAMPWLLVRYESAPQLVAARRTWWTWLVVKVLNVGRRVVRWRRGRATIRRIREYAQTGDRNVG